VVEVYSRQLQTGNAQKTEQPANLNRGELYRLPTKLARACYFLVLLHTSNSKSCYFSREVLRREMALPNSVSGCL
jgi:hypothetical protein